MTAAEVVDRAVENECTVIGALLLAAPGLQAAAVDELTDADFTDLRCRFALTVARRMLAEGVPVDQVTTHAYVQRHALLSDGHLRGSLALWLADRTTYVPLAANLPWYVLSVIEQASRRHIAEAGRRVEAVAAIGSVDDLASIVTAVTDTMSAAVTRLRSVVTR